MGEAVSHPSVEWTPIKWMERFGDWFVPIPETGCWIWMKALGTGGYGVQRWNGKQTLAHRMSYTLLRGLIPVHLEIDHLCRVRSCVNPDHMEPVTKQINSHRGMSPWGRNAVRTHCSQGHEFTPENTAIYDGRRRCRECKRQSCRNWYDKYERPARQDGSWRKL